MSEHSKDVPCLTFFSTPSPTVNTQIVINTVLKSLLKTNNTIYSKDIQFSTEASYDQYRNLSTLWLKQCTYMWTRNTKRFNPVQVINLNLSSHQAIIPNKLFLTCQCKKDQNEMKWRWLNHKHPTWNARKKISELMCNAFYSSTLYCTQSLRVE